MRFTDFLLEQPIVYSLWQKPFVSQKFAPVMRETNLESVRKVLDVGCGPGTNTSVFSKNDYLGVDINPSYIETARKKFNRDFLVADVTTYTDIPEVKFDFVLINSFLHHVDEAATDAILSRLKFWTSSDGFVHIIELVYPPERSIARFLAWADRGKFPRPLEQWRTIFNRHLDVQIFEEYPLTGLGATLWKMAYCKGKPR